MLILPLFAPAQGFFDSDLGQQAWVDSVFNSLTLEQKIGQLFMVAAYSDRGVEHLAQVERSIRAHAVGGLVFFQGSPDKQVELINRFQKLSKTPLLIGMDAEWGLGMRLDSTVRYPWAMTLGAVQDTGLIYAMGRQIAEQCKRVGIRFNLAPDADVRTNPKNPIIGSRSFGGNPENVATRAIAYFEGLQQAHVLACAKHFPGHGDTDADSHKALPIVSHSRELMDTLERQPFKKLIDNGVAAVMTAHLYVPAWMGKDSIPASVSKNVVAEWLRDSLQFKGLTLTDALDMKAVTGLFKPGLAALKAFEAGNDILLLPRSVGLAIDLIKNEIAAETIPYSQLQQSVKRILRAKYWVGLNRIKPIDPGHVIADLNSEKYGALKRKLFEEAITVVRNRNELIPIKNPAHTRIAYVPLGPESGDTFYAYLNRYTRVDRIDFLRNPGMALAKLEKYDLVIIGVHKSDASPYEPYRLRAETDGAIREISAQNRTLVDIFASPYSLNTFAAQARVDAIVLSYQNAKAAQEASAELIFGALVAKGELPVSVNSEFNAENSSGSD